ncbi:MAG: hypothetical protein ACRCYV_10575 [Aeromonas sp.]
MKIKTLLLALALTTAPLASHASEWSNAPLATLQQGAAQGDADAQFNLGLMYYSGRGVVQDYK